MASAGVGPTTVGAPIWRADRRRWQGAARGTVRQHGPLASDAASGDEMPDQIGANGSTWLRHGRFECRAMALQQRDRDESVSIARVEPRVCHSEQPYVLAAARTNPGYAQSAGPLP